MCIYDMVCRTTAAGSAECNLCNKMVGDGVMLTLDQKPGTSENQPVTHLLPGYSETAQINKPVDNNLSPFMNCNSKPIQHGNSSFPSVCTDSPLWSPGQCLFFSSYEGKFRRKQSKLNSPVILCILSNSIFNIIF